MYDADFLPTTRELEAAIVDGERPLTEGTSGRAQRRSRGQVFTPAALAQLVCRAVLGDDVRRVLDPACGDGRFLEAAAEVVGRRVELVGVERDRTVAEACRARVPRAQVHVAEALFGMPAALRDGAVDAVIGNPPYVRSVRMKESDPALWKRVRGAFAATAHGEWDLYGAFIEASLRWVRPGGRVGLIVPSRWLTARWAARLRGFLAREGAVRGVVDFGAAQVFPDATTYCSIVVMERGAKPARVPVLRREARGWERAEIDVGMVGEAPWIASGSGTGPTLGDVARIAKGTGTNADPVFVLPEARVEGALVRDANGVVVELAATRPVWRGRDVQPGATTRARCIVPYTDAGELISFATMRTRWPRAAAHLLAHRQRLEARERGRFAGENFHVFGRPQNLAFLLDRAPKVIVPDVARTPRAVLDSSGALVLDTAYALRPLPGAPPAWRDVDALLALFSSERVLEWLARAGVPLRGDYRRLKTAFLAPMPLPLPARATR
ncbi:MAG TPA: N-6 DNA methylase [Kofleriaceae bacterium]|nr:N-6 DNA methylase [Kofleriaceae bacterium]